MHKVVINNCYGTFSLSEKAINWIKNRESDFFERYGMDIPRHNWLLVQCIQELGSEANTTFSDLVVKEISGNVYRIDEYDGLERVIEPDEIEHWITIDPDE